MKYSEERNFADSYKKTYLDSIEHLISKKQKECKEIRKEFAKNIITKQDEYREEFKKMLGWPLTEERKGLPEVISEELSKEDSYTIYRMQFEVLDGVKMAGLFFKSDGDGKKPFVITQHGGWGTPELISGVYGNTANYNDMAQRVMKYGVNVFCPQLLLWADDYNIPFDRVSIDARLKRVGSSITAIEVYGILRIIDYFEAKDYTSAIGMVGLSYGGFYTLCVAAVDKRIKSAVSSSFFNQRDKYPWCDWTWFESAKKFDDAEIACLIYPRRLHLVIGEKDDCFCYKSAIESFERVKEIEKNGKDWVDITLFDGGHEFIKEDDIIKKFINEIK